MRKRILVSLLVFMMIAALLPASALAYTQKDLEKAHKIVDQANERIADVVQLFQESPLPGFIAAPLAQMITDSIANRAIARCSSLGVQVECVRVATVIKGVTVYIDPLIVISV